MQYTRIAASVGLVALGLAPSVACQTTKCNANNCARAITGTNGKPAMTIRREDCSLFFEATTTPALSTVYTTITGPATTFTAPFVTLTAPPVTVTAPAVTVTAPVKTITVDPPSKRAPSEQEDAEIEVLPVGQLSGKIMRRAEKPVPAYATACGNAAAYSSACSCWGVTTRTSEAPTPTSTSTIVVTPVVTETPTATTMPTRTTTPTTTVTPTVTVTALPIPAQCRGTLKTWVNMGAWDAASVGPFKSVKRTDGDASVNACCAVCYSTPNCLMFEFNELQFAGPGCFLGLADGQTPDVRGQSPQCPYGTRHWCGQFENRGNRYPGACVREWGNCPF